MVVEVYPRGAVFITAIQLLPTGGPARREMEMFSDLTLLLMPPVD